jgi:hypothetical protein
VSVESAVALASLGAAARALGVGSGAAPVSAPGGGVALDAEGSLRPSPLTGALAEGAGGAGALAAIRAAHQDAPADQAERAQPRERRDSSRARSRGPRPLGVVGRVSERVWIDRLADRRRPVVRVVLCRLGSRLGEVRRLVRGVALHDLEGLVQAREAGARRALEHPIHELCDVGGDVGRDRREGWDPSGDDDLHGLPHVLGVGGQDPREHPIGDQPEGPHVDAVIEVLLAEHLLGGHEVRCSDDRAGPREGAGRGRVTPLRR